MSGTWIPGMRVGRRGFLDELWQAERQRPDAALLRWHTGTTSVGEFATRVRDCAARLGDLGVGPGDRVAVMAANGPTYFEWVYGVVAAGGLAVTVNSELRGQMLAHVLADCSPALVLTEPEFAGHVEACVPDVRTVVIDEIPPSSREHTVDVADPAPHEPVAIIYTSGTTGPSKGVVLPHAYFSNLAEVWRAGLEIGEDDVLYFMTPFFHCDAHIALAVCISNGACLAFVGRFSVTRFWDDVRGFRATHMVAVGSVLDAVAARGRPEAATDLTLRGVCGAPISEAAYEFFEDELGIHLHEVYGQTEANPVCLGTRARRRRGTAGWPCIGYDVAVVDADGGALPAGELGEIVWRPNAANMMTLGYWGRDRATIDAFRDLWFHTGDRGWFDDEGFLNFAGRLQEYLRHRGENISAFELEAAIRLMPGISRCAAVAVPDEIGGEDDIKVFVSLQEGWVFDAKDFFDSCVSELPRFAVPRFVEVVDESVFVLGAGTGAVQKHLLPAGHGSGMVDRRSIDEMGRDQS